MNYVLVQLCLDESAVLGCLERAASVEFSTEGSVPLESVEITKTVDDIAEALESCPSQQI